MPHLQLQGRWLGRAGFAIGARVRVQVEPGRLVIETLTTPECAAQPAIAQPTAGHPSRNR
jgi:hypothetical protein